jgi:hypothetical protein
LTQVFDGFATKVKDESACADEPVKEAGSLEGQVGLRERVIADRRPWSISTGFRRKDTSDLANSRTTTFGAAVKVENNDLHPGRI